MASKDSDDFYTLQSSLLQMTPNNRRDGTPKSISSVSDSLSPPVKTIASNTVIPKLISNKENSKNELRLAKHRDRMRKRRSLEKQELIKLNAQVKALTEQLNQLLKLREYNSANDDLIDTLNFPYEFRREILMRSYVQLILLGEQLYKENNKYEEKLHKEWGRYKNFVNYQLQQFYSPPPAPMSPQSKSLRPKHILECYPMDPDKLKTKKYKSNKDGHWISFVFNPPGNEDKSGKNVLLFRESTDDVYYRHISDSLCKKLQSEALEEGMSFTELIQHEIQNSARPNIKILDYFGWRMTYYPISTQEAYPQLTHVTLDTKDAKDDMIRFDFVQKYNLSSHEDITTKFAQIRERCWKMMIAQIPLAGLHRSVKTMVGCVMQRINEQTFIVIRSYMNKKTQLIQRFVFMMHQYEHEVLVSTLNPIHCIDRSEGQDDLNSEVESSSNDGNEDVFWHTHGHVRFCWYTTGPREFEIRYGGTILLVDHSVESKIVQLGEVLVNWEQNVVYKSARAAPGG